MNISGGAAMTYPKDKNDFRDVPGENALATPAPAGAEELPPELACGNRLIDEEHRSLLESIDHLKRVCSDYRTVVDCQSCSDEHRRGCEHKLLRMLGDIIEFIIEHFEHEETLMRRTLLPIMNEPAYKEHVEAHANISAGVIGILSSLTPDITVEKIRDLELSLHGWLIGHIYQHDLPLADWLKRDDSMLHEI